MVNLWSSNGKTKNDDLKIGSKLRPQIVNTWHQAGELTWVQRFRIDFLNGSCSSWVYHPTIPPVSNSYPIIIYYYYRRKAHLSHKKTYLIDDIQWFTIKAYKSPWYLIKAASSSLGDQGANFSTASPTPIQQVWDIHCFENLIALIEMIILLGTMAHHGTSWHIMAPFSGQTSDWS